MLTNIGASASEDSQELLPMPLAHTSSSTEQQVIITNSQSYLSTPTSTNTTRYYEHSENAMVGLPTSQNDTNNNEAGIITSASVLNLGHESNNNSANGFVYEYYKISDKNIQWR